ncbi:hypothetical protein MIMGU_mgv1a014806mg [Erythranthe guttata]|uniref:Superoxide dismutase copper/zinc binding domain-containing protein n=1 Tax=Erythranthe guttata TaxID=4155 RepID=A0A022RZR4_ERYGU|nr:PREDICTED: copper chaperone for superoxide dismutase, chloroplastic/cytosolic-like [Erythranthe guttata]EYU46012.1 hypothetical protein MIMGU_mgv1a014806mg [Erythranthe guttata]|eukprot:XP_012836648.1 PREDICTED: copper chaperone for superoxide dismutase, chloroplastic/cytosolic-like [Erythranthe guttata]
MGSINLFSPIRPKSAEFVVSSAVAEFKGPTIFGVVHLAQVSTEVTKIEANFSRSPPGNNKYNYNWSINEFGDLTQGAATTGNVFNPTNNVHQPLGELGRLKVDEKNESVFISGTKETTLRVDDLIGRSIVLYATEGKNSSGEGIAAAVVGRSDEGGINNNCTKLCACDGTTIWEALA